MSYHVMSSYFHVTQDNELRDYDNVAPLPTPELSNLEEICNRLTSISPSAKDHIASSLLKDEGQYIRKLVTLFHDAEDLEQLEPLFTLFNLFKAVFMINDVQLFEMILAEDMVKDIIAILEYDPGK